MLENKTRVTSTIQVETRYGLFGALMAKLVMRPQMTRLMKAAIASFKDFVEQSDAHLHISAPTSHAQVA